jgi:branched-chain amino acid transport system permease protein
MRVLAWAVAAVTLAALPAWAEPGTLRLAAEVACILTLATLWNLLAGFAGVMSIGQQAFVGAGGYALFALVSLAEVPALLALPLAGLLAALVALPAAGLLFRLHGAQFAIGSWVLAETLRLLCALSPELGGGTGSSLPLDTVRAIAPDWATRHATFYLLAFGLAFSVTALAWGVMRSRLGLALAAMRDNAAAAASLGVDVRRARLLVYVGVAFATGLTGALIFLQNLRISPEAAFSVQDWTATVIFIVVVGGIGRLEGPMLGAGVYFALRGAFAEFGALYLVGLGALGVAVMLCAPKGIAGVLGGRIGAALFPVTRRAGPRRPARNRASVRRGGELAGRPAA